MGALLAFLPDEAMILVPVALGLMVIIGLFPAHRALSMVVILAAFSILMWIIGDCLDFLPLWALLLMMVWFGYWLVRSLAGLFLGKNVADHMIANLLSFLMIAPLRMLGRLVSHIFRGA
jgi:hypothetical protein